MRLRPSYDIDVYLDGKLVHKHGIDQSDDNPSDWAAYEVALTWAPFPEEDLVQVIDEDGDLIPKVDRTKRGEVEIFSGMGYEGKKLMPWRVELTERV